MTIKYRTYNDILTKLLGRNWNNPWFSCYVTNSNIDDIKQSFLTKLIAYDDSARNDISTLSAVSLAWKHYETTGETKPLYATLYRALKNHVANLYTAQKRRENIERDLTADAAATGNVEPGTHRLIDVLRSIESVATTELERDMVLWKLDLMDASEILSKHGISRRTLTNKWNEFSEKFIKASNFY